MTSLQEFRCESRGQEAKLPVVVSATSSSFGMAEYRACTSILIPTMRARMSRGFDGVRTVSGESDEHLSGGFSFNREKDQLAVGTLNRYLLILKRLIFESSVRAGSPSFVAAPDGPETCP
jgi:hypothetical protein